MPELPEVEVVRRGLDSWVVGRTVQDLEVHDPRSVRRHPGGPLDFADSLRGTTIRHAVRRGKFLWMPLDGLPEQVALVAHLGMSGQLLVEESDAPREKHLKVRLELSPAAGKPAELRFVDQRIFGGLFLSRLRPTPDGGPGGHGADLPLVPEAAAHIARDVLDPAFGTDLLHAALRRALAPASSAPCWTRGWSPGWATSRRRIPLGSRACTMPGPRTRSAGRRPSGWPEALKDVMARALAAGGTSFDSLYVNVNGASGYFDRSLNAYGRAGRECPRCAGDGWCP